MSDAPRASVHIVSPVLVLPFIASTEADMNTQYNVHGIVQTQTVHPEIFSTATTIGLQLWDLRVS